MEKFISWGISTLLLMFLNRTDNANDEATEAQQPSKFTDNTGSQIGNPVPVVLGRALIKNPLISFYGDFENEPYTEEYGMHTNITIPWFLIFMGNLFICFMTSEHPVVTSGGAGTATDSENGIKNKIIAAAVQTLLQWLLSKLFREHLGRTTIQKGFLYYLGWQHIICWTGGDYTGIKKIWMNVYDSEVEESTETGVWEPDAHVAWKYNNLVGIDAYIEDDQMFGGWDEGGGFIGNITVYFGTQAQPLDPWMVRQMTISENIPANLKGLTPKYPMYITAVVSRKNKEGGAYIGKQATVPEMWFEVGVYPDTLALMSAEKRQAEFNKRLIDAYQRMVDYMSTMQPEVQDYMKPYMDKIAQDGVGYIDTGSPGLGVLKQDLDDATAAFPITDAYEFFNAADYAKYLCDHGVWNMVFVNEDANPAAVIFEILTNKMWGCSMNPDKLDIDSLITVGIACEQDDIGVSCVINKVAQANEYITKILNHINGVKYDDPMTGLLTFKLIRNDYDVNKIKSFDKSNCVSCEFSRLDWAETVSAVSVTFTDAEHTYTQSQYLEADAANRLITQNYTEKQIDGEYFTTAENAKWLGQVAGLSAGYPLSAVNLVTNRSAYNVTIGDPIKVSWEPYGITQMVFRVTDIDYAGLEQGSISITAIEDMFGFDKVNYGFTGAITWSDPTKDPLDIAIYKYVEEPYELVHRLDTTVFAFAAQPDIQTKYWHIWRFKDGNYIKSSSSSTWSTVGRLIYGYAENYGVDDTGFEFNMLGAEGDTQIQSMMNIRESNPYMVTYDNDSTANLVIIDDEIISYNSIVRLPNGNYQLQGIKRGVYDTIPAAHTAESRVFFVEYAQNINGSGIVALEGDVADEMLEITSASAEIEQEFDPTRLESFKTTRRTEQPSIMANLQFGADRGDKTEYKYHAAVTKTMSYNILFQFLGRNKFEPSISGGIISQTDETVINVASDTQNVIRVECNGEEMERKWGAVDSNGDNVTDMTLEWADFCGYMGVKVSDPCTTIIYVQTYDTTKELYSYAKYKKEIWWAVPRLVGVVTGGLADAQALADTYIRPALNSVYVPDTPVSPSQTLTLDDCPLIFEGTPGGALGDVVGQDGNRYILSLTAYRIDGYDENGAAVIHQIEIKENFIFRTNFTAATDNYSQYRQWQNNDWRIYNIYTAP